MSSEQKQWKSECDLNGVLSRAYSHGGHHAVNFEHHDDHVWIYTWDIMMALQKDNNIDLS